VPYPPEPAKAHDLPEALDLLRRSELPTEGVVDHFGNYVVVRDEGHLVGVAGLEIYGSDALLRSVVVDPDYRGEGAGRALLEGVMALAGRMSLRQIYLLTTTARANFERQGFAGCRREDAPPSIQASWEFRVGCPSSSALMRRAV
jgi:amino-acid N-acetyltransferase